jgi:hypothetical protein
MTDIPSTSGRIHSEFVCLLFLQNHRETERVFVGSGVHLTYSTSGQFHYHRTVFSSQLKSKIVNILAKVEGLRITLNIDDTPLVSRSHTHPSHSETSRPLTSSLSLGVPVPHTTQCMRDV